MPDTALAATGPAAIGDAERAVREELAAAYRLAHHFGWNDGILNHISARVPDAPDQFLMNPNTLGWWEIRASDIVRARLSDGAILSETEHTLAPAGKNFHSAILRLRPDLNCVFHVHPPAGIAVSATKDGLRIFDQGGCSLHGKVGYHDFEGLAQDEDEGPRIVRDLGSGNFALIMWNHGLTTVGRTVAEAFSYMHRLVSACETQVRLLSMGADLRPLSEEVIAHTAAQMAERQGNKPAGAREFAAWMRLVETIAPDFRG